MIRRGATTTVLILLLLTAGPSVAWALTILDFEGVPGIHHFNNGRQNLGSFYAGRPNGPVFGPGTTILERGVDRSYVPFQYPPHSGNAVAFSKFSSFINIDFTAGPVSFVHFYYRSATPLLLQVFGASSNLLSSTTGAANLGPLGPGGFLTLDLGVDAIHHVRISGQPGFFVIDDFSYDSLAAAVPEPTTLLLVGSGLAVLGYLRRRRRRRNVLTFRARAPKPPHAADARGR